MVLSLEHSLKHCYLDFKAGSKPVHYRITFYQHLDCDLFFLIDYSFQNNKLSFFTTDKDLKQ